MNAELSINRLMPSRLLVVGVLILLLTSWTTLALASGGAEAANRYAAAWERYLAAQTPEALAPQNLGKTWDRFLALQNMEPVGAFLVPYEVGGADLAASSSSEGENPYAAAWERYLAAATPEDLAPQNLGKTWDRFLATQNMEPVGAYLVPMDVGGADLVASSGSEGENRTAAAWERYLAAQTPEALGDIGATWARFWDTQTMEAVGAFLVPMDVSGADLAASSGFAAANRYAAAWERYLASQTPEALGDMGATWARFWDAQSVGLAASSGAEGENRTAAAWERYLAAQTPEALAPQNLGKTWDRFLALQNMEAVGAYLIPMDVGGAEVAASSGFEAANRYAAAWQSFLATQNPQSMDLRNMGDAWNLFWANVEINGIVETEDGGFEVVCCR